MLTVIAEQKCSYSAELTDSFILRTASGSDGKFWKHFYKGGFFMKKLRIFLIMAVLALVFSACTAATYAANSRISVKPSNLKVENKHNSSEATFTWENPWPSSTFGNKVTTEYGCWGLRIDKSEDSKKTWAECVRIGSFDAGSSYYNKTTYYATLEHGKTYYFRAYYYDQQNNAGPMTTIGPVKWTTESGSASDADAAEKADILKKVKTKGKVTKSGGYGETAALKKGMKVIYDRGAYKLTVEVTSAAHLIDYDGKPYSTATFSYTLTSKIGKKLYVRIYDHNSTKETVANWTYSSDEMTKTAKLDFKWDNALGCRYQKLMVDYNLGTPPSYFPTQTEYFDFALIPGVLGLTDKTKSTKNTIKASGLPSDCKKVFYYRKKGTTKWSSKAVSGTSISITKLKTNTNYQVRYRCQVGGKTRSGKAVTLKTSYSPILNIRTQMASAPTVTSVSATGASYGKTHTNAHWEKKGSRWEWVTAYDSYYTTFTLTLKLKKPSGVQGFVIKHDANGSTMIKTGTTITTKLTKAGKQIGKNLTLKISSYTNQSSAFGTSAEKTVKVVIR